MSQIILSLINVITAHKRISFVFDSKKFVITGGKMHEEK